MKLSMFGAAAAALAIAGAAQAAGPVTVSAGGNFSSSSSAPLLTFEGDGISAFNANGSTLGSASVSQGGLTLARTDANTSNTPFTTGVYGVSVGGTAAKPFGDTTPNYYAILGNGSAELTGSALVGATNLSFFAGSIDTYNTVTFNYVGGSQTFTGSDLTSPALGNQSGDLNNRYVSFDFGGAAETSVDFGSGSQNAFEIDSVSVSAAPEPAIWSMMFMGVGMAGGALRLSRRRSAIVAA